MITDKVGNRIKGVESGKRNLSIRSLEKILNALDVSFEKFFKDM